MALTERSRSTLYQGLISLIPDEQAIEEMLSYFPARDVEEPVTKDFLRAEMGDLRTEMADLRSELRGEIAETRVEMERMFRSLQAWTIGAAGTIGGLVVAFGTVLD